ncbi:MAG: class I SAM-dependent methyltransferase [Bacteroidetes bacterium]|nr:class I SAM-dependent methyltransferase [Bacteroidota bacterium]
MLKAIKRFASTRTPKYYFLKKAMNGREFNILDIGAGNHSPSKTTRLFPKCNYYGVDLNKDYNYNEADIKALKGFYEKDLTQLQLDDIPDNFFDFIMMAHIIEHLHNGDKVIELLSKKLKKGGYIYIEYPGKKSTTLPSMYGTLNFYDDDTHVRVYSVKEISALLTGLGFAVLSSGMRRSWYYIFAIPFSVLKHKLKGKRIPGPLFWDLLGFAEYVYAIKM